MIRISPIPPPGVIAPASRIRPSRQGADQEQYENNDQYGSDHDDFLKPTQTRQKNAVYDLRFQQFANMLNCRSPVLLIDLIACNDTLPS